MTRAFGLCSIDVGSISGRVCQERPRTQLAGAARRIAQQGQALSVWLSGVCSISYGGVLQTTSMNIVNSPFAYRHEVSDMVWRMQVDMIALYGKCLD